jgi:ATP-dependent Clp protease adaptor protein ClpS
MPSTGRRLAVGVWLTHIGNYSDRKCGDDVDGARQSRDPRYPASPSPPRWALARAVRPVAAFDRRRGCGSVAKEALERHAMPDSIRHVFTAVTPVSSGSRMGNDEGQSGGPNSPGISVITKVKPKTKRPSLYRVLILNDDYTPMEFVVHVLERFFNKDVEAATKIMLHVHHHGIGECGVFTYEIAETKVTQVMDFARKNQHPLQCVMEKK